MTSDDELVDAVRAGSRDALAEIFTRHKEFIFRVALGMTGRRDDAAEIVQETFLALLERARTLDARKGRITTWLFEVARRRAADRHRRRRFEGTLPDWSHVPAKAPDAAAISAERRAALHRAVADLPERSREVFVLRIGMGLSVEETARILDCGAGAVRTALYDAHRRLQTMLADVRKGGGDARQLSASTE